MAGLSTVASTRRAKSSSSMPLAGLALVATLLAALCSGTALSNDDIDALLAQSQAPHGVVFEIVESDENALEEILPKLRSAIEKLRARFPRAEFAVVSHGREEFALQTKYQQENTAIHQQVRSLVADDVPVHVCETHAGWYGVNARDFPEYVNVSPTGPGQVDLYQELGYELVVVD